MNPLTRSRSKNTKNQCHQFTQRLIDTNTGAAHDPVEVEGLGAREVGGGRVHEIQETLQRSAAWYFFWGRGVL